MGLMSHYFPHQYVNLCSKVLKQMTHHGYIISATSVVVGHKNDGKTSCSYFSSVNFMHVCISLTQSFRFMMPKTNLNGSNLTDLQHHSYEFTALGDTSPLIKAILALFSGAVAVLSVSHL